MNNKELHAIIETHLQPYHRDPSTKYFTSPLHCPICKRMSVHTVDGVGIRSALYHTNDCYWFKRDVEHIQTYEVAGTRSGEFEVYNTYVINTRPRGG